MWVNHTMMSLHLLTFHQNKSTVSSSPVSFSLEGTGQPVYSLVARQRTSVRFKLAGRGDTGAGGLVAPLSCTVYFGKLTVLFGCSLPQQA